MIFSELTVVENIKDNTVHQVSASVAPMRHYNCDVIVVKLKDAKAQCTNRHC